MRRQGDQQRYVNSGERDEVGSACEGHHPLSAQDKYRQYVACCTHEHQTRRVVIFQGVHSQTHVVQSRLTMPRPGEVHPNVLQKILHRVELNVRRLPKQGLVISRICFLGNMNSSSKPHQIRVSLCPNLPRLVVVRRITDLWPTASSPQLKTNPHGTGFLHSTSLRVHCQ